MDGAGPWFARMQKMRLADSYCAYKYAWIYHCCHHVCGRVVVTVVIMCVAGWLCINLVCMSVLLVRCTCVCATVSHSVLSSNISAYNHRNLSCMSPLPQSSFATLLLPTPPTTLPRHSCVLTEKTLHSVPSAGNESNDTAAVFRQTHPLHITWPCSTANLVCCQYKRCYIYPMVRGGHILLRVGCRSSFSHQGFWPSVNKLLLYRLLVVKPILILAMNKRRLDWPGLPLLVSSHI